ncbi:MAG: hypothetical protein RMY16_09235 [Nostoc sp. DedQUE12b]|uniref:hypothetical protein n=1 Tax=Nostoc sp. DedQUE12b TaxID=3075398 RepID=UPI002AD594A4|nr:hypothetical protein [Nostoc sp. DedQUE12b]MDZ8085761.1 hypothetical protein [Nostoc sp. DedQUE12b]
MDFESIMNMPAIAYAIEDGRQWELSFANNFYWVGNRDNIAKMMNACGHAVIALIKAWNRL